MPVPAPTPIPLHTIASLTREWRRMLAEYNAFYAARINDIMADREECMAALSAMRVAIDRQLERIAQHPIESNEDAACILAVLFDVTGTPSTAPAYRAGENLLAYLRGEEIRSA